MECVQSLWETILAWYRSDRIRISPTDGRLLGLEIGDEFICQREIFSVVDVRQIRVEQPGRVSIVYGVMSDSSHAELVVDACVGGSDPANAVGRLQFDGDERTVFESDLTLLRKRRPQRCR